jgi:hypothetical protein
LGKCVFAKIHLNPCNDGSYFSVSCWTQQGNRRSMRDVCAFKSRKNSLFEEIDHLF